ncbi:ATP-binding protein [Aliikangiella sp. IMCC44359]|uniref:ATP-binding protein n=1 Tax=Aliikangiella sp. IMCC44359 TaxID=3459125 RepID=UPI00403AD110
MATNLFGTQSTLKRQLLGFLLVSVIFVALTTSIITAWQTSEKVKNSTIETGLQVTRNFSDQTVLALLTGSEENAQEAVNRAIGFESVNGVAIFDSKGVVLVTSAKSMVDQFFFDMTKLSESPILIEESESSWTFGAPVYFEDDDFDSDTVEPDEEAINRQIIGHVLVKYNKRELREIQHSIFISNIITSIIITVILAVFISIGLNRLIRPLTGLSRTMETAGKYGEYLRAEVDGATEIRQMASTYNQMMHRLEQANTELEKHRDTLESEVEIRTQELKVARDTALTANRHKSEFLANISHELRTPLQAIIGYTDLVKEELEFECMDSQASDLNKAIRSAHHLLGLINNILDLAKIEAGRMDLYLQSVDMEYLINDTLETIQPMAEANGNELQLIRGELSKSLLLDRQKMLQVFLNLLSNACKFTKQGKVIFEIYNDPYNLYFSVKDTGIGIAQEQLEYIFEEFTQVDGAQTRKFEGTGLGMAITKSFCDLMNGQITVNSELSVGTTFSVKMPIVKKL